MKPRIGKKVYCVYKNSILVKEVGFLGNESFIVDDYGGSTYEDSWEWYYEDYGKEWFTSIAKAKKELRSRAKEEYGVSLKIIKPYDDCYVLEDD